MGKLFARGNVCTESMLICCLELVDRKDIPSLLRSRSLWETYLFTGSILIYCWEPVDWKCTLRCGKPVYEKYEVYSFVAEKPFGL